MVILLANSSGQLEVHSLARFESVELFVGLHFLDIPFNLQFHGILRSQIQDGKVLRAQILFDPTVIIRQCDCISQYYKSTAFPIAFGMVH